MRKALLIIAAFLPLTLWPAIADACEPMYPFLIKFVFPSSMSGSVYGLLVGVIVKCALFAFLVRRVTWLKAAGSMLLANIITSLFGLVLVVILSIPIALIMIPLVCYLATLPSKSLRKRMGERLPDWLSPGAVAAFLFLAVPLNGVLFYGAENANPHTGHYWFMKLAYIYAGLAIGIGMTTLWEEWLAFSFAKPKSGTNFLSAVLRTNLYTFLVLAFIGAGYALPQRLSHSGFLLLGK
jgi:hypothetical protein